MNPENISSNPLINPYFNPMQTDMLSISYGNPFFFPPQSYDFLYMIQARTTGQSAVGPNNYWVQSVPEPFSKQTKPYDPLLARPINYIPPLDNNTFPKSSLLISDESRILKRAAVLPTTLTALIPRSEHMHYHSEFCGHSKIVHNDHIDFLHNAELHHVTAAGSSGPYL
eukprot:TRINITY_DN8857_c0_g2_i3.p1 TRINITY_DN8857_c0_g2~~TRINITY_DN8857_c0_g2_i3.p1  ORF type:complete len:169 (-),score=21.06 TRINITY_DN8857_c0_g2_i3:572-1078(-)